ncbi:MAG TPA: GrpB family protein [Bdellovibrio sp.]|uniref:GrpB family protein n=1 Tax=Bdellovibrio sp. TaxID=28201 RepID=UPI002F030A78
MYSLKEMTIIQILGKLNLGLERDGRIELKSCPLDWQKAFEIESARIQDGLSNSGFKIFHIGSTSIPSILAKPILDILIEAPSLEIIDQSRQELETLGYEYKGEYGIRGRRYYVLYNLEKTLSFVHIHAFAKGSLEIENHLLFRDYLIAHPNRATEYQNLKLELTAQSNVTREKYTELKSNLIHEILLEAKKWRKG